MPRSHRAHEQRRAQGVPAKSRRNLYIVEIEIRKRLVQELDGIEPVVLDLRRFVQREAQMIFLAGLELRRRFRRKGFLLNRQGKRGRFDGCRGMCWAPGLVIYRTQDGGDGYRPIGYPSIVSELWHFMTEKGPMARGRSG